MKLRAAPRTSSDVLLGRGLWLGSAVAAVAAVAGLGWALGPQGLWGPGPQSRPHALAGVGCSDCHQSGAAIAAGCVSCHGPHPSARPAHRALAQRGQLGCASCHAAHTADEGVALLTDGRAIRYGTGWETDTGLATRYVAPTAVNVPLVPLAACTRCHDPSRPEDPIAACLLAGQEGLGDARPTVCFDEHRPVATTLGDRPARDGAWEAAREVAATVPAGGRGRTAPWLIGALGLGLVAWGSKRALWRLRERRRAPAPEPVVRPSEVVRLPQIDTTTCLGCYACVDACPYDVLEVRRFVAVVARPDDCCGLTLCEQHCPNGSLVVRDGEPVDDRPRVTDALESVDVPGLYLAGDLTGLPLIKNAINQGAMAVRALAKTLPKRPDSSSRLQLLIVGAGPAGISAALAAREQGLAALVLEQSTVAASIRSFPRGKLVFDQPLGVPLVGDLWLEEATKEELLSKWLRIVRRHDLAIREGLRVSAIERVSGGGFRITALDLEGNAQPFEAERVVVASGRRGSPRRLEAPVDPDAEAQVYYSLADARSFAGQRVLVVGLGDSAMEAALALARQPDTRVTIVHRGEGFRRGKARNISELTRAVEAGRIELRQNSAVRRVRRGLVEVERDAALDSVACDAVLVQIGALPPWSFLESVGVRRPTPRSSA